MKRLIFPFTLTVVLSFTFAQKINGQDNHSDKLIIENSGVDTETEGRDFFVHPFLSHMALAAPPGEVSSRLNGIQIRNAENLTTDFGYHIVL